MIEDQLQHRTIRFFEDKPVAEDVMDQVYDVYNRTATSNGLQTTTLIRITDPGLKQGIAEIADQAYIAKMPELFIFLADSRRLTRIAQKEGGSAKQYKTMDQFMQGVADSYLASQNVANALEELGLGTVFLGSVLNDSQALVDLLNLPTLTFPVVGLGFGYPDDSAMLKPRLPLALKLGENAYPEPDNFDALLAGYDEEMTHYYDSRDRNRRSDSYSKQVTAKADFVRPKRANMLDVIAGQGFELHYDEA